MQTAMKTKLLILLLSCSPMLARPQGFVALNLYQAGSSTFEDDPIGTRKLNTSSILFQGRGLSTDDEYFWGMDASSIMRMLVMSGKTKDEFLHADADGFKGFDMPTLSLRLGKMGGKVGGGVDMDVRALFFEGPVDSLPNGYYRFNSDKIISDFNFGPVVTGYFPVGDFVAINPTIGYSWMFLERQETPVDGHLFLIENSVLVRVAGPIGVNVETDLQIRRMKMDLTDENHPGTMFCLKFGLTYMWD